MSKEIPILFKTEMVRAILGGTKTMTRRIIKESFNGCLTNGGPHPCPNEPLVFYPGEKIINPQVEGDFFINNSKHVEAHFWCSTMDRVAKCKYGKPGDLLWVRETFGMYYGGSTSYRLVPIYKATEDIEWMKWKPAIFMPKKYARIWLEVINVTVEPIQDISDGNVAAEGVTWNEPLQIGRDKRNCKSPAQRAFRTLWDKINGVKSWDENPWCWCVSFKVLSTTGKNIVSENGKITLPAWSNEAKFLSESPYNKKS